MQLNKNEYKLSSFGEVIASGIITNENAVDVIIKSILNYNNKKGV